MWRMMRRGATGDRDDRPLAIRTLRPVDSYCREEDMKDPNKDPNIYGSDAHRDLVERDKHNARVGWGTPNTQEGRNYANELAREKKRLHDKPPPSVRPIPDAPAARQVQYTQPSAGQRLSSGGGLSSTTILNILAAAAGLMGAIFAAAQGVRSTVGLGGAFVLTFLIAGIALRYVRQLVGLAVLGLGLYTIFHYFAVH